MVTEQEVEAIGRTLVDTRQPLQARFRALFTLRGLGGPGAIAWISRAFGDDSALLKHELAYCLGQMQDSRAIPVLVDVLRDARQEPMVRHEAGEWPGRRPSTPPSPLLGLLPARPRAGLICTGQAVKRSAPWARQPPLPGLRSVLVLERRGHGPGPLRALRLGVHPSFTRREMSPL